MIAIVLDGQLQSALAAAQSLGQKNIRVICGASRRTALSLYSRYCSQSFLYTSPRENRERFILDLLDFLKGLKEPAALFSFSDETFLSVFQAKERLAPYVQHVLSNKESIEIAFNKEKTLRLAQANNIPIPKTYFVSGFEEAASMALELSYPLIIKPRQTCSWKKGGNFATVEYVSSSEQLKKEYKRLLEKMGEPPLIQEVIQGEEIGIFALMDYGQPKALFAHRRIRSISPLGGASCLRESIKMPAEAKEYSLRLLRALSWHGVAMVEFKVDKRDGVPKLMEINGRFWGSLPLAIYAGVDFPYLFYQAANRENVAPCFSYQENIKSRHLLADLKHLISVLLTRKKVAGLPYPKRFPAIVDFLKFFEKDLYYDVESWSDPKPFLAELIDSAIRVFKNEN